MDEYCWITTTLSKNAAIEVMAKQPIGNLYQRITVSGIAAIVIFTVFVDIKQALLLVASSVLNSFYSAIRLLIINYLIRNTLVLKMHTMRHYW